MSLIPIDSGGVSIVTAGEGIEVVPNAPDPTVSLNASFGGFYKSAIQTVTTTGAPAQIAVEFDTPQTANGANTTYITPYTLPSPQPNMYFVVNKSGLYLLTVQLQMRDLNLATLGSKHIRASFNIQQNAVTNACLQSSVYILDQTLGGASPCQINGVYRLQQGSIISISITYYMSAGSFYFDCVSGGANAYDLNTQWNWVLLREE